MDFAEFVFEIRRKISADLNTKLPTVISGVQEGLKDKGEKKEVSM